MPSDYLEAMREQAYMHGSQRAWLHMLQECLLNLGYGDSNIRTRASFVAERHHTILVLRRLCEEHGDNNWPDDLHLSDIIEKHLVYHLVAD